MEQEPLLIGFQSVSQDTPSPEHLPSKSTFATARKPESPSQVVGLRLRHALPGAAWELVKCRAELFKAEEERKCPNKRKDTV